VTAPFEVEWTTDALDDWKRLSIADAEEVAFAVQRFARGERGLVIAGDGGTYLLLVGVHVVVMLVPGKTIYVTRVRLA
jgi:hypothetical protein